MIKTALILAPHPDDESITGLLPLRLQEECGFRICVIPVTWGSRMERQAARKREMKVACAHLGFQLCKRKTPIFSKASVQELTSFLKRLSPTVVFMPHAKDGHPRHQATHQLGMAAMDKLPHHAFHVVETEYWHPLLRPNLMVAAHERLLKKLCGALACHAGEVARNDYAARLPAWMMDNVRRGSELIGGAGAQAEAIQYATLYRARRRKNHRWFSVFQQGRLIESSAELGELVTCWDS